jgi:transcriptional regulator with XRE-family HTH domain
VRLDTDTVSALARQQGLSLSEALRRAGVSRTAFYSLARRPTALPGTITLLARVLGVPASRLLSEGAGVQSDRAQALLREARRIRARSRGSVFENVWHTLNLLELTPAERLARSLLRGRTRPVHR